MSDQPENPKPRPVVGLLIPEFPTQTHCAWWRVGNAFKHHGVEMQMLSTRMPDTQRQIHDFLIEESKRTHYNWPPSVKAVLGFWLSRPAALFRGLGYITGMKQSSLKEKLRALPLMFAGADLAAYARRRKLDAIFVHSCANAAHVAAMCHAMGGPPYALRLGGDPDVYGKDHASKMRRAVYIASSSPSYYDQLRAEANVPDEKLMWTWVGTDLDAFRPADRKWERQSEDALHVVTVARLTDTKGHADVLQALKLLKDRGVKVRCTMVGAGPEEENLQAQAQSLGITDQVVMTGPKPMGQVIEQLRVSDAAILASYGLGEAAPAVLAEAMACGVPMVCTRIGATPLMFTDGEQGMLVPQRDPQALADALEKLATDEPARQAMAQAAHEHARVFDCREIARNVLTHLGMIDGPRYATPTEVDQGNGTTTLNSGNVAASNHSTPHPAETPA